MEIARNRYIRRVLRKLASFEKRVFGQNFPKMKRVVQITASHCGPAVLQSLFSYLGVRVSQRGITRSIQATKKIARYGLDLKDMARAAKIKGQKGKYVFWRKDNASIGDINKIINKYHYPVGVEWQGVFYEDEYGDNGHYSIVTAINRKKGYVKLADSYRSFVGIDRKFRIKDFVDRWWDTNMVGKVEVFDRKILFIITPKEETFPKKLGLKK